MSTDQTDGGMYGLKVMWLRRRFSFPRQREFDSPVETNRNKRVYSDLFVHFRWYHDEKKIVYFRITPVVSFRHGGLYRPSLGIIDFRSVSYP